MANTPAHIMLGKGVFSIDGTVIGLTRGGGTFTVEYENRKIEADGDRGGVKGRIVRDTAIPKLTINHLELATSLVAKHPGVNLATDTLTGTGKITDSDYHTVLFTGEQHDGTPVKITLENAINLENINWTLADKDEVVDTVTFEGCYLENASDKYAEPWKVDFK